MGIQLTTEVVGGQVDLGLVEECDHLDVVRGGQELNTLDGTVGNETSTVLLVRAPSDFDSLGVGDGLVGFRGRPQAEIYNEN